MPPSLISLKWEDIDFEHKVLWVLDYMIGG